MAAAGRGGRRTVEDELRRRIESRQRRLRARIAACEELTTGMAALRAALAAGPREAGPAPTPPGSPARRAPGPSRADVGA